MRTLDLPDSEDEIEDEMLGGSSFLNEDLLKVPLSTVGYFSFPRPKFWRIVSI